MGNLVGTALLNHNLLLYNVYQTRCFSPLAHECHLHAHQRSRQKGYRACQISLWRCLHLLSGVATRRGGEIPHIHILVVLELE